MNNQNTCHWNACTDSEVRTMVRQLKRRRLLSALRRDTMVVTTFMVLLFSGYFYFGVLPETKIDLGGVSCIHVQRLADQFLSGELDNSTNRRLHRHLRHCEYCRNHFDRARIDIDRGSDPQLHEKWDPIRRSGGRIIAERSPRRELYSLLKSNSRS
jgi:hypothetical protein